MKQRRAHTVHKKKAPQTVGSVSLDNNTISGRPLPLSPDRSGPSFFAPRRHVTAPLFSPGGKRRKARVARARSERGSSGEFVFRSRLRAPAIRVFRWLPPPPAAGKKKRAVLGPLERAESFALLPAGPRRIECATQQPLAKATAALRIDR